MPNNGPKMSRPVHERSFLTLRLSIEARERQTAVVRSLPFPRGLRAHHGRCVSPHDPTDGAVRERFSRIPTIEGGVLPGIFFVACKKERVTSLIPRSGVTVSRTASGPCALGGLESLPRRCKFAPTERECGWREIDDAQGPVSWDVSTSSRDEDGGFSPFTGKPRRLFTVAQGANRFSRTCPAMPAFEPGLFFDQPHFAIVFGSENDTTLGGYQVNG
jgi:hypothetical protein